MELLKAVATRKSTRKFKKEQISQKELETILLAGSAASVGMSAYKQPSFNGRLIANGVCQMFIDSEKGE